jgi:CRISPR system Cascade subunit CasD
MSDNAYLALLLDAPMQSWGFASRFQRRTTGLHPTKSGVIGMICAAIGLAKGSADEQATLPDLAKLKMTSIAIPRIVKATGERPPVLRLEDYHTVENTRRASGSLNRDAVVTHRQYLLDARFGVILYGSRPLLRQVAVALQNPVWGVWLGRKSCIPAELIYRGMYDTEKAAQRELLGEEPLEQFSVVAEVNSFAEGTDSISDQPVSFGDNSSSGPEKRRHAVRRIAMRPGHTRS